MCDENCSNILYFNQHNFSGDLMKNICVQIIYVWRHTTIVNVPILNHSNKTIIRIWYAAHIAVMSLTFIQ